MRRNAGRRCIGWDLDWPERLFVTAVRVWLGGASARADFLATLRHNLGSGGTRAAESLDGFLEILVRGARRVLWFRRCDAFGVTADERALVALVAAVQHREEERAAAALRWLLPRNLQSEALARVRAFAAVLADSGFWLSMVSPRRPPAAPRLIAAEPVGRLPTDAGARSTRAPPSRA